MTTIESLKAAIVGLPNEERHALAAWLNELDDDWDAQIAQDLSPGGRGAHLADKIKTDIAAGKFRPLEEFCTERRQKRN